MELEESKPSVKEMVAEANRRQQDPATRIEPGPEAAAEVLGENAEVSQFATALSSQPEATATPKRTSELTPEDIAAMDDETFKKLDIRGLSRETMYSAFQRKAQS